MKKHFHTLLLSLLAIVSIRAQQQNGIIQEFLQEHRTELGLSTQDINDWVITDQYESPDMQVTHVYIRQRHAGIEVFNGTANLTLKDGSVFSMAENLKTNLAIRANTTTATLSPEQAIQRAALQLNLVPSSPLQQQQNPNSQQWVYSNGGISEIDIPVKLVYQDLENGELRLAYDLSINVIGAHNWWSVRVDAVDGQILERHDWNVSCTFGSCNHPRYMPNRFEFNCSNTLLEKSNHINVSPATDQYTVFPIPVESPAHGARSLLVGPANTLASPFGWHDTNGAVGAEFTITNGNNVLAQDDQNGNNGTGASPNGGAALQFNFALNLNQAPSGYLNAASTNLFYMNNIMHDVWYQYGFTEAAGNFQENNYGRGGAASDNVNADSQDGSGLNNANFATPADGGNPRMQMFLWSAPANGPVDIMTVNAPATLAGGYNAIPAAFGPAIPTTPLTRDLVLYDDNTPDDTDACQNAANAAALSGRIAVIRRGTCPFVDKVFRAQVAGAVAVIMVNNAVGTPFIMGGTDPGITIPSVMISMTDGDPIINALLAAQTVNATLVRTPSNGFQLDGDFDNGIIAHEYGHGISNRLTGGPAAVNCLSNAEQMGEGWSDWFALMLTIEPGDRGTDARGIGTYAIGESPSGGGIRPMPYSTDPAINNATYGLSNTSVVPHGVGFVWCSILWDLSWAFIDVYGYDPDVYNGTGGNNMAMALVIQALKLQPCSPGFVDGRNAILQADQLLNAGANECLIWNVFANRGLGNSASQGSRNSSTDQVEAFNLPAGIPAIGPCLTSLPINLKSFDAIAVNNEKVNIFWTTSSEEDNDYFTVERSKNGLHFEEAGRVSAVGNSTSEQNYSFTDENPYNGVSYYRLKQTDKNMAKTYSEVRSVEIKRKEAFVQIMPNPNRGVFDVTLDLDTAESDIEIVVRDIFGKEVSRQVYNSVTGFRNFPLDISKQPAGAYLVTIKGLNNGFSKTLKMVKN